MVSHRPDLVIKLNVNLEVTCAHKPDHEQESLAKRAAIAPQLALGGTQLVGIDTNRPLEKALVGAGKVITDFMTAHGYHQWRMEVPDRQDRVLSGRLSQLQYYPVQPTRKKNRHR